MVVGEADFIKATDRAESAIGLEGQPRAVIFHEKEGRRHAHVVWSRIDAEKMRAINLPHFKRKLTTLSRELYLDHDWTLPEGLRSHGGASPLNFNLDQWQRAKRLGVDPREIKDIFCDAYARSDSLPALKNALEERGYFLAQGDRRSIVALDVSGEPYALGRWSGIKAKELRERFGSPDTLPSVDDAKARIASLVTDKLRGFIAEGKARQQAELAPLRGRQGLMREAHRAERQRLNDGQAQRWAEETKARTARLRTGLSGLWDRLSGRRSEVSARNEAEALAGLRRDAAQRDQLIASQLEERATLQASIATLRRRHLQDRKLLTREVVQAIRVAERREHPPDQSRAPDRRRGFSLDL